MLIFGVILGFGGILLGNVLEGGHIGSLLQGAAFVIVMTGTFGAVIVSSKKEDFFRGFSLLKWAINAENDRAHKLKSEIIDCARLAKKESLLALEPRSKQITEPFLKNVIRTISDGVTPDLLQETFSKQIELEEKKLNSAAKIWSDAGGFSPTIGIIGAVLGLIHVMGNLTDTSKLGSGIAVAFVATIYGVASANLLFLPIGNLLKKRIQDHMMVKEMILDGGVCILKGMSPNLIELKLQGYFPADNDRTT